MRIAVASCGLDVAPSFSQCENFNYYTTKSCEIVACQNLPAQGLSAAEYAEMMEQIEVTALLCDEIGGNAKAAFAERGIEVKEGVCGSAIEVAEEYIAHRAECILYWAAQDEEDEEGDD